MRAAADLLRQEAVTRFAETDIDRSNYHWVRLSGLEPGCKYCYTVGDDEHRIGEFTFETEPEKLDKFSFIVISDHQKGSPCHLPDYSMVGEMLKTALAKHPECRFIFTAGDNCDNGQNDLQWNGMFEGLKGIIESLPYMMTTGNHDNRGFISYFPELSANSILSTPISLTFSSRSPTPTTAPRAMRRRIIPLTTATPTSLSWA